MTLIPSLDRTERDTSLESAILNRLITDRKFRETFFASPRAALEAAGIDVGDVDLRRFEPIQWKESFGSVTGFEDGDVLRMSAGY